MSETSNYRVDNINAMNFITPHTCHSGRNNEEADISVNIVSSKATKTRESGRDILSFIVRNGKEELIAPTRRVAVCMVGNRIYFKDDTRGFRIIGKKDGHNKYFRVNYRLNNLPEEDCKAFIGDYELKYNKSLNLYYIEKK